MRQYEKGELTVPAMGEQNFEFVNLNEPVFKKSQLWVIGPLYLMDEHINALVKGD